MNLKRVGAAYILQFLTFGIIYLYTLITNTHLPWWFWTFGSCVVGWIYWFILGRFSTFQQDKNL